MSMDLESKGAAWLADLMALSGHAFDVRYMDIQVAAHTGVLLIIDQVLLPSVRDAALRNEVTTERAAVEEHLLKAAAIDKAVRASAP